MVRGLTTFILQRLDIFFDDYELPHDSFLIIDGDSVAINIYEQLEKKNSCFGGDYDDYAIAIQRFFKKLLVCKITPYVLLDGATAPRKVNTAAKRFQDKIQKSIEINCTNEKQVEPLFPLFLTEVFKGIIKELNIAMVMCDFDCDREVANIAKKLNSPVLSYDSDFFIYDVKYIPFVLNDNEQNLYIFRKMVKSKEKHDQSAVKHLKCKIFNRKNFLRNTRLTLEKLPILSVYLGNDYIDRATNVPQFYRYLNLKRGNFVENIINWFTQKSPEEAINKILNYYENKTKTSLKTLIDETIEEYTCKESHFLTYLQSTSTIENKIPDDSDYLKKFSKTFIEKYRRCFYPHQVLDILLFNKYIPRPLVENISKDHSYQLSFPLISAVHKILTDDFSKDLIFYGRVGKDVSEQVVPKCEQELPNYEKLQVMDNEEKLNYFLKLLNIEEGFKQDCLEFFPKSWHMLLITMKYICKVSKMELSFIYALIMTKIMLSYVDKKLGCVRTLKDFDKCVSKYGNENDKKFQVIEFTCVSQALDEIDINDSLNALEKLLPYFEISMEMKSDNMLFNRNLVHSMSEFQSCLYHIDLLNDIFCRPFEKCLVWELYNGTFIYNLISQLQTNQDFIHNLLAPSPTILRCFVFIVMLLKTHLT